MDEFDIVIDTDEIEEFFHRELVARGYAPGKTEVEDITDIVFEYLLSISLMTEIDEDEHI